MARGIGLDLGGRSVKILSVQGSGRSFSINAWRREALPPGPADDATVGEVVDRLFRQARLPREPVSTAMDAQACVIREISVPFKNPDQIRKVVRFESEGHLFSYALEEVVVDHIKTGETKDRSLLTVIAAPKTFLGARLKTAQAGGIDPLTVDLDVLALWNAVTLTDLPVPGRTFAVADIGARSLKFLVIEDGRPVLVRSARYGTESLTSSIQRELLLEPSQAEEKQKRLLVPGAPGTVPAAEGGEELLVMVPEEADRPGIEKSPEEMEEELLEEKRVEFLEKLAREILRTLATVHLRQPVSLLAVTGGGSRTKGLLDFLAARLQIEVRELDLLSFVGHPFAPEEAAEEGPLLSVPLGLALKAAGHDRSGLDFRQEELRYQKRFDQIRVPLAICATLIFLFFFLVWVQFLDYRDRFEGEFRAVVASVAERHREVLPGQEGWKRRGLYSQLLAMKGTLQARREEQDLNMGRAGELKPLRSALATWRDLFAAFQRAKSVLGPRYPIIDGLHIAPDKAQVNLVVEDFGHIGALQREVTKNAELFESFEQGTARPSETGGIEFKAVQIGLRGGRDLR